MGNTDCLVPTFFNGKIGHTSTTCTHFLIWANRGLQDYLSVFVFIYVALTTYIRHGL